MDATSQQKVIAEGFRIIRCDDYPSPRIKIKDKQHAEWSTLMKFDTKAKRDRQFKELLKLSIVITD